MKAAISKWVEKLVKDPDKARQLLDGINRAGKDPANSQPILVDGKYYKVRLAGSVAVPPGQK